MKKVIVAVSLAAIGTLSLAYEAYQRFMPEHTASAVISDPVENFIDEVVYVPPPPPQKPSQKQARLLNMAKEIAKAEGVNPEVAQGVLLQETDAGGAKSYKVANPGPHAYFGPMQVKLSATRDVLKRNPDLYAKYDFHTRTDDEIKANLILNEDFNLRVGIKYLKMLKEGYGLSGRKLVNAYNRGPGGVSQLSPNFHYAVGAEKKLAAWKTTAKKKK